MENLILLLSMLTIFSANEVLSQSTVRFSNITELGMGFQVGKTVGTYTPTYISGIEETVDSYVISNGIPAPRLITSFGVMLFDLVFVGLGAGYVFQANEVQSYHQHSVMGFSQARLHFSKGRFRPFTDLRAGYNYSQSNQTTVLRFESAIVRFDGVFVEPSLGMAFKIGEKSLFNIGLGYQFLTTEQRKFVSASPILVSEFTSTKEQHRLILNLGFTFK